MKSTMEGSFNLLLNYFPKKLTALSGSLLLALTLASCDAQKTDAEYLESAKQFAAQGDIKSYEIELKNALQQNPGNAEARKLLGLRYLADQRGASAEKELKKALEYNAAATEIVPGLLQAKYYQYQYRQMIDYPTNFNSLAPEDKAKVYVYRGLARINLNEPKEAEVEFDMAAQASPSGQYSKLGKAYLYSLFKNYDDAIMVINDILKKDNQLTEAHILLSRVQLATEQLTDSLISINKAIELEPNRLNLYITSARTYMANKQNDEAEKKIDIVLQAVPEHLFSNLIKARLRLQAKDWENAELYSAKALSQSEVNKEAKLISGISHFYLKNWERARDRLASVKSFIKPDHIAHRMLAYAEFKLGYSQSAKELLTNLGELSETDTNLLNSFGAELAKEGRLDDAASLFETAAGLSSSNTDSLTKLGILKLHQSDLSGIEDLEKALEKDSQSLWARAALARHYLKEKQTDKAIKVIEDLLATKPDTIEPYILASEIYTSSKRYKEAEAALKKAEAISPDNTSVLISFAKLTFAQKDANKSLEYLEKTLKVAPDNEYALLSYYSIQNRLGDVNKALKAINSASEASPEKDSLKLIKAMALLDQKQTDEAIAVLSKIPSESAFYARAQSALGTIYLRQNEPEKALSYFISWKNTKPNEVRPYISAANVHFSQNNPREALNLVNEGLQALPDNKELLLMEIKMLLHNDQVEKGKRSIAKYIARFGNQAELSSIRGSYHTKKGEYKEAMTHFKELHKLSPSSRSVIAIADLELRNKNETKAAATLDHWLEQHPNDVTVRLFRANLALNQSTRQSKTEAVKQYSTMVKQNPKNYIAHNNLAWVLGELGKVDDAVIHAQKAHELRPDLPAVLDTYGYLLLLSGDAKEAETILSKAHSGSKDDPTITFHYAMALSKTGKQSEAKALLTPLETKDFPEKEEAKRLLKTL